MIKRVLRIKLQVILPEIFFVGEDTQGPNARKQLVGFREHIRIDNSSFGCSNHLIVAEQLTLRELLSLRPKNKKKNPHRYLAIEQASAVYLADSEA